MKKETTTSARSLRSPYQHVGQGSRNKERQAVIISLHTITVIYLNFILILDTDSRLFRSPPAPHPHRLIKRAGDYESVATGCCMTSEPTAYNIPHWPRVAGQLAHQPLSANRVDEHSVLRVWVRVNVLTSRIPRYLTERWQRHARNRSKSYRCLLQDSSLMWRGGKRRNESDRHQSEEKK